MAQGKNRVFRQCGKNGILNSVGLQNIGVRGFIDYYLDGLKAEGEGTVIIANVAGAVLDDAEGTIDMLRNIEGVEIAAFLKEKGEAVKVSMRAKSYANVAEIVSVFGGGGHVKAAGCTLEMGMDEALDAIKKAIGEHF